MFHLAHPLVIFFGAAANMANFDCILNCDRESLSPCLPDSEAYLHLPIVVSMKEYNDDIFLLIFFFFGKIWNDILLTWAFIGQTSKFDRFSLLSNLSSAVDFAKLNLSKGKTLLICCRNGKDSKFSLTIGCIIV